MWLYCILYHFRVIWHWINRDIGIIGSALALHCCKAHAKINRKIKNSTTYNIVTHEDFNLKLSTRDYVADATQYAIFGSNRSSGGFPPNMGNITLLWLLLSCDFFSILRPGRTVAVILTVNGSNDVFPPKKVPLGVRTVGDDIMRKIFPTNFPKKGVNRQLTCKN